MPLKYCIGLLMKNQVEELLVSVEEDIIPTTWPLPGIG
jgi:hypothetical protein